MLADVFGSDSSVLLNIEAMLRAPVISGMSLQLLIIFFFTLFKTILKGMVGSTRL